MLQQTQVPRVLVKYKEFLKKFPTVQKLATAPLREVLILWQGLGYNRRAKFLHQAAQQIVKAQKKYLASYDFLISLPGVGQSTAGAIIAFTQNTPVVFVETNIRAVLMHHFYKDTKEKINDQQIRNILSLLLSLLPKKFSVRDFYYALYDYGTFLKTSLGKFKKDLHKKSAYYTKQSRFIGSRRQLRAFILKTFLKMNSGLNAKMLSEEVLENKPKSLDIYGPNDVKGLILDLQKEGFFLG
jgi:A/G-specific adenine glycosylase